MKDQDSMSLFTRMINLKTGKTYLVVHTRVINCTNAQDGQEMVLYTDGENMFCRSSDEFKQKFRAEEEANNAKRVQS